MAHQRRFRFGVQAHNASSGAEWRELARKAESLGYSTLFMPDHLGDQLAPIPALAAAAEATSTLRLGALVFDNDYRHPVVLAKEAATIDLLSDGRLELGLGAGWMRSDYEQSGISYDEPRVRIERFEEGLRIIKGLWGGGPFSFEGRHYGIDALDGLPKPAQRPHPPILVGAGAKRMLGVAAREADIVGVNVHVPRGEVVGPEVGPNATAEATARKVGWVRDAAGERFDDLELNMLVGFVIVTSERRKVAEAMGAGFGLTPDEALASPHAIAGTIDEMCEELHKRRAELCLSYHVVPDEAMDDFAPVVERLAGR